MLKNRVLATAARSMNHMPKFDHGLCCLCDADVPPKHYCWGCYRYVCVTCEKFSPEGPHKPEDHVHASPVRGLP